MTLFEWLVIALILAFSIVLPFVFAGSTASTKRIERRSLPALDRLNIALTRAAETGQSIHVSPGAGALHGAMIDPETLGGLVLAQRIAETTTRRGGHIIASNGDGVSHIAMRGVVRAAYRDAGYGDAYTSEGIQLHADHDTLAFAAGMGNRYATEPMEASIAVGSFGDHYLLLGEQGRQYGIPQVAGTTNPTSLAAAVLTADGVLMGEEIYAAEAYVNPTPAGLTRLRTHDAVRMLLLGVLVAAATLMILRDLQIIVISRDFLPLP